MSPCSRIKYFRFMDAPNFTYRLEVEAGPLDNPHRYAIVRWSSMRGEHNQPVQATSLDAAEARALDQMYNHLIYLLRVDRIATLP